MRNLLGDERRPWRRIVPAVFQRDRQDVDMRVGATDIGYATRGEPRITGGSRYVDRRAADEQMRIGEIEGEIPRNLVARPYRGPEPVIIRYERRAHLIGDRRN